MRDKIRFAAVVILANVVPASAGQRWEIMSHNRRVWAEVSAGIGRLPASDSGEQVADFGLFDEAVQAVAEEFDAENPELLFASASGHASQESVLTTRGITASGSAGGTSETTGAGSFAETDALSLVSLEFEVTSGAALRLAGSMLSNNFGQCNLRIDGPPGFVQVDLTVQDSFGKQFLDEEWDAPAGTYSFFVDAFADSAAANGNFDGQGAMFAIELSLLACGTPEEPLLLEDVGFAVTGQGAELYRNLDVAGGQDWAELGSVAAGAVGQGVAVHPVTKALYVLYGDGVAQELAEVDPLTAGVLASVPVTITHPLNQTGLLDIAFRADGTLYGAVGFAGIAFISTVDTTTGVTTSSSQMVPYDFTHGAAMAFHPDSGLMYHAAGTSLYEVDVDGGSVSSVPLDGAPVITGLAFAAGGQTLIAGTDAGETEIIDPVAGSVTPVPGAGASAIPGAITGLDVLPMLELPGGPGSCVLATGNPGDVDGNGAINLGDHASLFDCLTGPGGGLTTAACLAADFDEDGDADLDDFRGFQLLDLAN